MPEDRLRLFRFPELSNLFLDRSGRLSLVVEVRTVHYVCGMRLPGAKLSFLIVDEEGWTKGGSHEKDYSWSQTRKERKEED